MTLQASAAIPTETAVFPPYLQVETVARCNARCTMCSSRDCRRDDWLMNDALFDKIADEIAGHADGVKRLTIQGLGEPLLDKKLEARITALKNIGIKLVAFATNGSLMNEHRTESILNCGVDEVTFSMDGITKSTYESIRIGLNFDEVLANIERFIQQRNQMGVKTVVRIRWTAQQANGKELAAFNAFWKPRLAPGDSAYAKIIHTWGNTAEFNELPENYDFNRLNRLPCPSLWTSLIIFSDGQIPLCCSDYNARTCLGNVSDQSIAEIWKSPVLAGFRQRHLANGRGAVKMCTNCVVWDDDAKINTTPTS